MPPPIRAPDLNPDVVSAYLNDNPAFLDSYVANQVHQDTLERWTLRKKHQHKTRMKSPGSSSPSASVNGEVEKDSQADSLAKWKSLAEEGKRKLLQQLTEHLQHQNQGHLLYELAACTAAVVRAEGFSLYLVDEYCEDIYLYKPGCNCTKENSSCCRRISESSTVATHVARTGHPVCVTNVSKADSRFSEYVGSGVEAVDKLQSLLAQPVMQPTGEVAAVIEVYRKSGHAPFTQKEEEAGADIVLLGDLLLNCQEMYQGMVKQRKLNEFLLVVTKSIFQDIVSMDTVIMKIMKYAQTLVDADRASLFLVDNTTRELYARIFDVGSDRPTDSSEETYENRQEIRFTMDKGVAGHVASTGEILNITDAYADERFNREVDLQTGYRTKTILCMPIYIRGSIIGVVQMVNKLSGTFTKADEESFETFAIYCGLALHHCKLYEKIRRSEQKYKVALEVLSYHSQASEHEVEKLKTKKLPEKISEITRYHFSPWSVGDDDKPLYVIYMFQDLLNMTSARDMDDKRLDMTNIYKFTLTVRKNYRQVPYHNWAHAFSVAHAMYTIIKTTDNVFTPLEAMALYVACLCHDLDHRGKTNSYMSKYSTSPLAALYSTSVMEHHHFNQTVAILQQEGHNIFKHLTSEEYKQVLGDIKNCILATDLALFFGNRARLKELVDQRQVNWSKKDHRRLVYAIAMTASDLCVSAKPWDVQIEPVRSIFEEFYAQGDQEKLEGRVPAPMMDRSKQHEMPELEVGFLVGICLPCYELLAQILPETTPMVEGAKDNLKRWEKLAAAQADNSVDNNKEGEKNKIER